MQIALTATPKSALLESLLVSKVILSAHCQGE